MPGAGGGINRDVENRLHPQRVVINFTDHDDDAADPRRKPHLAILVPLVQPGGLGIAHTRRKTEAAPLKAAFVFLYPFRMLAGRGAASHSGGQQWTISISMYSPARPGRSSRTSP
jgi:hypothetical protein